jgi:hypothetical protein
MISVNDGVLKISGNGLDLLAEIGLIITRMVSEFDCPPELLTEMTKNAIELGLKRSPENDKHTFSFKCSEPFSDELIAELENCDKAEDARKIFEKHNITKDKQSDALEQMLFKKMFGDLLNE